MKSRMKDWLKASKVWFRKTGRIAKAIGRVTFLEIIRDKVLYNIVLCTLLLFGVGLLASRLAVFKQDRVLIDFGLTTTALSCLFVAVLTGAGMLGKEFDRRTVLVALSRPISRFQFVIGKFCGLAGVLFLNWLLLVLTFGLTLLVTVPGEVGQIIGWTFCWALWLAFLQSLVLAALAVFFSSFTTTSLSVIFTVGLFLIGTNISQLRWLATRLANPGASALLNGVAAIFPNFEYFNLGVKVTYGLPVTWGFGLTGVLYALVWVILPVSAAGYLVRRKEA